MRRSSTSALALTALAAFAVAGCSSDNGNNTSGGCSVTVSGGLTGTYTCTLAVAAYSTQINTTGYNISLTTPIAVNAGLNFLGEAATGTNYTRGTAGASGAIAITSGSSIWSVAAGTGGTGTYTLTLSSVSTLSTTATGKAYTIHGTLDATIPASAGSTITTAVTLHATF
jgi:hypothetical protein